MIKVAIDAGHGSNTAGKRTPDGLREHTINVRAAYYCEQYLKAHGVETIRVGWNDTNSSDDADTKLSTRQKKVKKAKCDASISFHANAYGSGNYNSANGVGTFISNNPAYVGDSLTLANKVQNRLIKGTAQKNRKVKTKALSMCNCKAMGTKASVLCEIGFMTNRREAELMSTEVFCKEQGEDAAKGILDYFNIAIDNSALYKYNGIDYSLIFDPTYYANKYNDLRLAFGSDATKLFNHFCIFGMQEGRQGKDNFDVLAYKARYADLQNAFKADLPAYYKHYIKYGYKEGRIAV